MLKMHLINFRGMVFFFKLINKIDKLSWITLRRYYCISEGIIVFQENIFSKRLFITCGVKQGEVISPFLFNLLIYDLISECLSLNIEAKIGSNNMCVSAFADDNFTFYFNFYF
jgi:hypothetical protein